MNRSVKTMSKTVFTALFATLLTLWLMQAQAVWSATGTAADQWQFDAQQLLKLEMDTPPGAQQPVETTVDAMLMLRFAAMPDGLGADDIALLGPHGTTAIKVFVSAAQQRVFIDPRQELLPGANYTVVVKASQDQGDLHTYTAAFATAAIEVDQLDRRLVWAEQSGSQAHNIDVADPEQMAEHFRFPELTEQDDEFWMPNSGHLGNNWRTGRPLPEAIAADINLALSANSIKTLGREQNLNPEAPAESFVSGQIFKLNDQPLAGVQVSMAGQITITDAQGRYRLNDIPAGYHQLLVDGSHAGEGNDQFAESIVGVEVYSNQQTPVKPMYLPKLRQQDWIDIPSPLQADLIVQSELMPGFEIHLPAGTVLRGRDGEVVRRIASVPMPLDRVPVEYPVDTPLHMTLQPAGMSVENIGTDVQGSMQFVYPNYAGAAPGTRSGFLNYDPEEKGWYIYGYGQVSDDGLQVVPDEETVVYRATGFGIIFGSAPPAETTPNECAAPARDGDPVDLATGLFLHETQGPQLADVMPIDLRTKYRPNDDINRGFGKGTMHSYGAYLYYDGQDNHDFWHHLQLVLPDCSVLTFDATSPDTGFVTTAWTGAHTSSPTPFYGATLEHNGGLQLTLRDGRIWQFSLAGGHLLSMTDRFGRTTELTYANGGRLSRITSPSGRFIDVFHEAFSNRIIQLTDISGRSWHYSYNVAGYLSQVTYPDNSTETFDYDANNRMYQVHNRLGQRMVLNSYDIDGRISAQTLADGAQYAFSYVTDANDNVTSTDVTRPNGTIRRVTFENQGYPLSDTDALGTSLQRTLTYERDSNGFVDAITDPLGRRTELAYDSDMRLTSLTVLAGTAQARTSSISYNTDHDMVSRTDSNGDSVSYVYDHLRRVTRVSDSHGRHVDLTYNGNHQLDSITDHLGRSTLLDYQLFDLFSVTNVDDDTWYYLTDNVGRVIEQIDPLNQRTRYTYDVNDDITQVRDPRNQLTQLSYDALGYVLSVTDPLNGTTVWGYDNRQRTVSYTDPLSRTASCTYASNERSVSCTDRGGRVTDYTLDDLERLSQIDYLADSSIVTLSYDLADRLTGIDDTLSGTLDYVYSDLDQLLQEITPSDNISYQYDARLNLSHIIPSGLTTTQYGYDSRDRLTQITQGAESVSMGYDAYDRRTSVTLPNGVSTHATFNDLDQLTELSYQQSGQVIGNLTYTYDDVGQIIARGGSWDSTAQATLTTIDGVADAHNQLQSFDGLLYTYDVHGNLIDDGVYTYTYDSRDRLIQMNGPGGLVSTFTYDAANRRISKTINGQTTDYRYDGLNPIAELTSTDTFEVLPGPGIDERYGRDESTGRSYFLTDHQGSTIALTGAAGQVQGRYHYEAYGETQFEAIEAGFSSSNPYQYTGRENDENGLYHYRARYYSPTSKRFTQQDPLGMVDGPNQYAYVVGNPVSYTDPTGEVVNVVTTGGAIVFGVADIAIQLFRNGGNFNCIDWKEFGYSIALGFAGGAATKILLKPANWLLSKLRNLRNASKTNPKWPKTPQEMDDFLGIPGKRVPDGPTTPGRNKVVWKPNQNTKITYEKHPYHKDAPDWHRNEHWHLDTPGRRHKRYLPGEQHPGY